MPALNERFNPYKLFHGSFIPEWLECRPVKECSVGAKLIYARLSRYAGKNGHCYPKIDEIALSTGFEERQVRRYLSELKELKLIESVRVGKKCTNRYFFLWHKWIAEAVSMECDRTDMSTHENSDRTDMSIPMDRTDMSAPQKENQERESNISPKNSERWNEYSKPFESRSKTGDCDEKLNKLSDSEYVHLLNQRNAYINHIKSRRKTWATCPMKNASTFLTPKYWKKAVWLIEESSSSNEKLLQKLWSEK